MKFELVYDGARPNRDILLHLKLPLLARSQHQRQPEQKPLFKHLCALLDDCWRVEKGERRARPKFCAVATGGGESSDGNHGRTVPQRLRDVERATLSNAMLSHLKVGAHGMHEYNELVAYFADTRPHIKMPVARREKAKAAKHGSDK